MEPPRRLQRHSVVVDVAVFDLDSGFEIQAYTRDLNLFGCSVPTTTPFPAGTKVVLRMSYRQAKVAVFGRVVYGRLDIGMGIVFTVVEPEDLNTIESWISELILPS
jgi:hypothetical protein